MKNRCTYYALTLMVLLFISREAANAQINTTRTPASVRLKETYNEEDIPVNEYLGDRLQPIRANFKRINAITNWDAIDTEALPKTGEDGEAKYYYQNGQLEKIITRQFGEMGQLLTEYYLLNRQLSFVLERSYHYNPPMYL